MTIEELEKIFYELRGKYKHFCYSWDGLPIDETCPEFESCECYFAKEKPTWTKEDIEEIEKISKDFKELF